MTNAAIRFVALAVFLTALVAVPTVTPALAAGGGGGGGDPPPSAYPDSAQYHLSRIAAICRTDCAEYRSLAEALEKPPGTGLVY